ncbi:hypothetical protein Hdeb2414_s0004g00140671 [Helianthus debilis subsp. tardiflorus]
MATFALHRLATAAYSGGCLKNSKWWFVEPAAAQYPMSILIGDDRISAERLTLNRKENHNRNDQTSGGGNRCRINSKMKEMLELHRSRNLVVAGRRCDCWFHSFVLT